ncbi:MAG TPA: MFS transporter [Thermoanaerobaculia bacterium]|nr:MFS transporter [Thermoanaerobaculia bacterium]
MSDPKTGGMKTFGIIWIGQLVSLLGSGLTSFALGIWVLRHTDSVTQYTLTILLASLPGVLISPLAGALVDRWDRRWVMFWSDVGPGVVTLVYSYLLWQDSLTLWHVYVGVAINALFSAFQWPAYIAAITMLVERKDYGRVNGMLEFGQAGTSIAAPALAALFLTFMDMEGILLLDFVTFLFAAGTLLLVRIPKPEASAEGEAGKGSLWKEVAFGWHYIRQRPGLFHLLMFFAMVNLVASLCGVALIPMVYGFASEAGVGTIMSLVGIGMLLGGFIMTTTGGPKPRVYGVLGGGLLFSVCFILVAIKPSLPLVGLGVILWYTGIPIMNASSSAIWQAKVAPDVQGRVFSMRRMIAQFTIPIGDFGAGPLADLVFNPLMMAGGALAGSAGRVIGTGPGRGIALMFLSMAFIPALAAVWGLLNPRLRNVEAELPDAEKKVSSNSPDAAPEEQETAAQAS